MTNRRRRLFSQFLLPIGIKLLPDYMALANSAIETAQLTLAKKIGALLTTYEPNRSVGIRPEERT